MYPKFFPKEKKEKGGKNMSKWRIAEFLQKSSLLKNTEKWTKIILHLHFKKKEEKNKKRRRWRTKS